jgi:uncharacterized Zn finger protein (UPF0148 family)
MELKKCQSCQKAFFGERGLTLCPICTVVEKGNRASQRLQATGPSRPAPVAAVAVAR